MCFRTFKIIFIYITLFLILTSCETTPVNGYHERTFTDGNRYAGNWENSKLSGYGTYTFASGIVYTGNFSNGKYHGQGVYTEPGKRKYSGNFIYGVFSGQGTLELYASDTTYEGIFQNNQLTEGKITYRNGRVYEGKISNFMANGPGKLTYPDGSTKTGDWSNNICKGCKLGKAGSSESNNSDNIQIDAAVDEAKSNCKDLGFKEGTEKFGECVLELTK